MLEGFKLTGFEWDDGNAHKSRHKHGVPCEEAESVFASPMVLPDPDHSTPGEPRWHAFGMSSAGRPLAVTFTVRQLKIRIISARPMNKRERKIYGYNKK